MKFLIGLDNTLDFLRSGELASKLQIYFINEGANVILVMDTYANYSFEEVSFKVCRHDLSSSLNQSVSCCDCYSSVKCEWGILDNPSLAEHACQLSTSYPGLYQFEIYTSLFQCYQKIGHPIEVYKVSSGQKEEKSKGFIWIIMSTITAAFVTFMTVVLITCQRKKIRGIYLLRST